MEFYSDSEPWNFPKYQYPTWDDCMRYYMSRIKVKTAQKKTITELALAVETIWKAGDGCPKHYSNIMVQFEKTVFPQYQKYRKGDGVGNKGKKRKKLEVPSKSPARKSVRHQSSDQPEQDPSELPNQQDAGDPGADRPDSPALVSKRKEARDRKEAWMREHGSKLFDVFSGDTMVKVLEDGLCFDSDFYEDQKDPNQRELVIETVRVRKEYVDAEKALSKTKARKFARKMSAFGQSSTVREF